MTDYDTQLGLWLYMRPDVTQSIPARHNELVLSLAQVTEPFGWRGLDVPDAPERRQGSYSASFVMQYPDRGVRCSGSYMIRDPKHLDDVASDDDRLAIEFDLKSKKYDFRGLLTKHFPDLIVATRAYRAAAYYGLHTVEFDELHQQDRQKLKKKPGIDVNGRNNIFTLQPAQFWDAELCQRALGYGRDEVIRRLTGKVPLVQPLMDGVYVVFNDNPDLTFEEFCAYNDRLKPVLGLQ
ncbi:MAG: hypothetical protein HYU58_18895 [Proteobacteria bacterium]|nr:hypothetical protein [Pseudomonadota bacterium]